VIVEGEGTVLGGESLGLSIETNGIVCVRGGDAALPKLLWDLLVICTVDKAHRTFIFAITQLS